MLLGTDIISCITTGNYCCARTLSVFSVDSLMSTLGPTNSILGDEGYAKETQNSASSFRN